MGSPFDILGVGPDADEEELKQAYRERAKEAHPDQGGSVEEFQLVRAAYDEIQSGYEPDQEFPDRVDRVRQTDRSNRTSRPEAQPSRVEYLNYEVLDDFGWAVDDPDLFEKADRADLDHEDYGQFLVQPDESLLEAAENRGFAWPFACRGGACANCAIVLVEGELAMPVHNILPDDLYEQDIRLSCNGRPLTEKLKVVYNAKHLPDLEELQLPPYPFERAYGD
ncbi:MAG: ferredoxin Fer [Haloferacaceae archaeon]